MRKINLSDFKVARRSTARDINRQIALNLVRDRQPISRADLARHMNTTRGIVGVLVNELIAEGLVYEGPATNGPSGSMGRKPVFLYVRTRDRLVVAADVRASKIDIMLCDFAGHEIELETIAPVRTPAEFIREFPKHVTTLLARHGAVGDCEGVGVVVPGMVDRDTGRVISAPPLGWKKVAIRDPIAKATGLPVCVESAARACALAQMWLSRDDSADTHNFIYVSISDGVGAGAVVRGELVRGHNQIAGEFGHIPLSLDGPRCACGANGCWMAYISNPATIARYGEPSLTVSEIVTRAQAGDAKAIAAIQVTARYLGLGLVAVLHSLDPACVYVGGEIIAAWDLIEPTMRSAIAERALGDEGVKTLILPSQVAHPRLRGAAALIAAPTFAAPHVA